MLPIVLYGRETEHKLRVFESSVLRRIFGQKRDKVTGRWKKLQNEELHNLYFSSCIIRMIKTRRMKWAGHIVQMWEKRNECMSWVEKPKGKRPIGRQKCRWTDSMKMDLGEIR
jgi:hypothetical protein